MELPSQTNRTEVGSETNDESPSVVTQQPPHFEIGELVRVKRIFPARMMEAQYGRDYVFFEGTMLKYAGNVGIIHRPTRLTNYWKVSFFFAASQGSSTDRPGVSDDNYDESNICVYRWIFHGDHLESVFGGIAPLLIGDTAVVIAKNDRRIIDRRPDGWSQQLDETLGGHAVLVTDTNGTEVVALLLEKSDGACPGVVDMTPFLISMQLLVPLIKYDRLSDSYPYKRYRTDISHLSEQTTLIDLHVDPDPPKPRDKRNFKNAINCGDDDGIADYCTKFPDHVDAHLDDDGWTGLMIAVQRDHLDATDMLLLYGANPSRVHHPPFGHRLYPIEMALNKSPEVFSRLVLSASDDGAHCGTIDGGTLLHLAVNVAAQQHFRICIESGLFDVNKQDTKGKTPFHVAVSLEHEGLITDLLCTDGVDASIVDVNGDTPLGIAISGGNLDIVEMIVEAKSDTLNLTTEDGVWVPLMLAAVRNPNYDITEYLLTQRDTEEQRKSQVPRILIMMLDPRLCGQAEKLLPTSSETPSLSGIAEDEMLQEYIRVLDLIIAACPLSECDQRSGNTSMHVVLNALFNYLQWNNSDMWKYYDTKSALESVLRGIRNNSIRPDMNLSQFLSVCSSKEASQLVLVCYLSLRGARIDGPRNRNGHTPEDLPMRPDAIRLIKQYQNFFESTTGGEETLSDIASANVLQQCIWCCVADATITYLPCRHRLLCAKCATEPVTLPRCFTCKQTIESMMDDDNNTITAEPLLVQERLNQVERELEELKESQTCQVCYYSYDNARGQFVLDCGHNFCGDCVLKLERKCPLCRKNFAQPRRVHR